MAWQASRCQKAFSKPRLVNLIQKDTHPVFSIYLIYSLLIFWKKVAFWPQPNPLNSSRRSYQGLQDRKFRREDRRSASRGLPSDDKRLSPAEGRIYLSYPHMNFFPTTVFIYLFIYSNYKIIFQKFPNTPRCNFK